MLVVRPAQCGDLDRLVALGAQSGTGAGRAHRMPVGRAALGLAIERSQAAFAASARDAGDHAYLFVLAHDDDDAIDGCASLTALVGAQATYFAFRRDVLRQVSVDLNIAHDMPALTISSDLSRHSHLGACFARDGTDAEGLALLARARLLYTASFPHRFAEHFFASLPGVVEQESGCAPFWDAVGAHFFGMPLASADAMLGEARNHPAMVEMMPHYSTYLDLLPAGAQQALGRFDAAAAPVHAALLSEGFSGGRYAGLLDGGALLHAHRSQLRCFAAARRTVAAGVAGGAGGAGATNIVATVRNTSFRAVLAAPGTGQAATLDARAKEALALGPDEQVVCLEL